MKRTQPQLCGKEELHDNKAVLLLLKKVKQHNRFGLVEKRGRQRNRKGGGGGGVGKPTQRWQCGRERGKTMELQQC